VETENDTNAKLLTVTETAQRLGVPERTVRTAIAEGHLRAWRIGKNIRVPEPAIAEFLAGGNAAARPAS
jgi:excisionase family DNA binding protein